MALAAAVVVAIGVPRSGAVRAYASGFTIGSGYVARWLAGDYGTEIWAAPLSGGQALASSGRQNTRVPSRLAVSGKTVFWPPKVTGGIYQAPVTGGGTTRETPGSRSTYIPLLAVDRLAARASGDERGGSRLRQREEPGDRRHAVGPAHRPRDGTVRDVLRRAGAELRHRGAAARRGGGRRAIPGGGSTAQSPPLLDRFIVTLVPGGSVAVYDLRTGKMGDLRIGRSEGSAIRVRLPMDPANRLYYTTTTDG
jgi:hypothetical protein